MTLWISMPRAVRAGAIRCVQNQQEAFTPNSRTMITDRSGHNFNLSGTGRCLGAISQRDQPVPHAGNHHTARQEID
ncbi:hypothetical protein D3C80_1510460 [compost metagenome]